MLSTSCKWGLHSRLQGLMLPLNFCAHTTGTAFVPLLNTVALQRIASLPHSQRAAQQWLPLLQAGALSARMHGRLDEATQRMISPYCPQLPSLPWHCPRGLESDMDSQRAWASFADAQGAISAWLSLTPRSLLCSARQLPSSCSMGRKIEERLLQRSLVLGL